LRPEVAKIINRYVCRVANRLTLVCLAECVASEITGILEQT